MHKIINKSEESRILYAYRYISLAVTSIFYLFNHPDHILLRKVIIIGCLSISAIILSYLYTIYEGSKKNIMILIAIETIGNSILLVPSGGINSPFIWYTLNTILISSIFLKKRYCWINFAVYLISYGIIIYFSSDFNIDNIKTLKEESSLLLSFILIIAAVQLWTVLINKTKEESKRLEKVNLQLESANQLIVASFDHIKALYQSVNILANQGNKDGIIKLSFDNIKKITKTNTVFYYDLTINKMIFSGDNPLVKNLGDGILEELDNILEYKAPIDYKVSNSRFIIMPVYSNYPAYGILGLEATSEKENIIYQNNLYQLQFISELMSNAFDRLSLEVINERILITEEQNRIANEIHDSVLQRLFSMSCSIFSLMKKIDSDDGTEVDIVSELNLIRRTTDTVMKELREKIYGLSWKKSGTNSFSLDLKRYIDDIKNLNNINIPFSILGNIENLSTDQKKALYRMICEGLGNAVRHGRAKNVEIKLDIGLEEINLSIIDDGIGFDLEGIIDDTTKGLGIQNLYQLAESLNGELEIKSKLGSGTKIEAILPKNAGLVKGVAAI